MSARTWWQERSGRERAALAAAGIAIVVLLGYDAALGPVGRSAERARQTLAREELRLARMRLRADEALALARQSPNAPATDLRERVARWAEALPREGESPVVEAVQGGQVRLRAAAVQFDPLVGTLEEFARETGARIVELDAAALAAPGYVRLEVTFAR